ncbi:MAG: hypothetical protein AAFX54_11610 [Pseudomonadota bacterium]
MVRAEFRRKDLLVVGKEKLSLPDLFRQSREGDVVYFWIAGTSPAMTYAFYGARKGITCPAIFQRTAK